MSEPTRLEDAPNEVWVSRAGGSFEVLDSYSNAVDTVDAATTADLVEALKAEGFIVIGRDENGEWPSVPNMSANANLICHLFLDALASVQEATR